MRTGAMSGYCSSDMRLMDRPPASMMTMAMTQAKMGRSMKKRAIVRSLLHGRAAQHLGHLGAGRHGVHYLAHHNLVAAFDDQSFAGSQATGHAPLAVDDLVHRDLALKHLAVRADHQGRGFTAAV